MSHRLSIAAFVVVLTLSLASVVLAEPPAPPSDIEFTGVWGSHLDMTWTDNSSNETGFVVERCAPGEAGCGDEEWEFHFMGVGGAGRNVTTFHDIELQPGGLYEYRVYAFNGDGQSEYSEIAWVNMGPWSPPPAGPSNLGAVGVSTSKIDLTWTDNASNEDGFWVYRCDAVQCGGFVRIAEVGPDVTSFQDVGLREDTAYMYSVFSFNSGGSGHSEYVAGATLDGPGPNAPANLRVTAESQTDVTLGWTDSSADEDGFRVYRCDGPLMQCGNQTMIAQLAAGVTAFLDVGLVPNTRYTYVVHAFNGAGSSNSNAAEATTMAEVPAAPANLTATPLSPWRITLSWVDNSANEAGFRIYRCDRPASECTSANFWRLVRLDPNVTTFDDTYIWPGSTHTYIVYAYNTGGSSGSNAAEVTSFSVPNAPSNLTATAISGSQIQLEWVDNSTDEDGFLVWRCDGPVCGSGFFVKIAAVEPGTTRFIDADLSPNGYLFAIEAFNSNGGSVSNWAQATIISPPAAPANLTAAPASSSRITLSWTDTSANEEGFRVYRCNRDAPHCASSDFALISQLPAGATTFDDTGLNANSRYSYFVSAFNIAGGSSSNPAEATTFGPPAAPTYLKALAETKVARTAVNLVWLDNSGNEELFRMERCTGSSCTDFALLATIPAGQTTDRDTSVERRTVYRYRVRAENQYGASSWSNISSAMTP